MLAGVKTLLLSSDCADLYNPKVIRSTMGAIFRVNAIIVKDLKDELLSLKRDAYEIVVTSLQTQNYIYDISFAKKNVIVIGNESKGVSKETMELADKKVKIPMIGRTESLNAAVAASVIAYEGVRQQFQS